MAITLDELTVSFRSTTGTRLLVETSFGLRFDLAPERRLAIPLTPCCMRGYRIARTMNAKPECSQCSKEYPARAHVPVDVTEGDLLAWVEPLLPPLEATLAAVELQRRCVSVIHIFDLIDSWEGRSQAMRSVSGLLFSEDS